MGTSDEKKRTDPVQETIGLEIAAGVEAPKRVRTEQVNFRMTHAEGTQLRAEARRSGLTLAEFVSQILKFYLEQKKH